MFGLIKLALLVALIGSVFFVYDFFDHLEAKERVAVKEDIKDFLDSGKISTFCSSLGAKMQDDFRVRFWPKVNKAFRVFRGEDENKPRSALIPPPHQSIFQTFPGSFVQSWS